MEVKTENFAQFRRHTKAWLIAAAGQRHWKAALEKARREYEAWGRPLPKYLEALGD